jgi:hypothetical protein
VVSFADGFTSGSSPNIEGSGQEDFVILNNQSSSLEIFTLDSVDFKSAFVNFELTRKDVSNEFRQAGQFILSYNGSAWTMNVGNYQGSDLIADSLTSSEKITLTVTTSLGVASVKYTSGNMGSSYTGELKCSFTRIVA